MEGDANGAPHLEPAAYAAKFSGKYENRIIKGGIGHNLPQEAPEAFAKAVVDVDGYRSALACAGPANGSDDRIPRKTAEQNDFLRKSPGRPLVDMPTQWGLCGPAMT